MRYNSYNEGEYSFTIPKKIYLNYVCYIYVEYLGYLGLPSFPSNSLKYLLCFLIAQRVIVTVENIKNI